MELDTSSSKKQQLSDDTGGEPEEKYRGWKAMPYVIGNETFEKLGTIGTTANLLVYLTTVYGMKSANAATLLNLWGGTVNLAPLLGAFLSDTYLGRYATIAFASIASFLGMLLLTLTAAVPSLHPHNTGPSTAQLAALLVSFALLAVGAGGIRPCNLAFGADQFDPRTPAGRRGIASFFNWYYFTFTIAMMLSATLIIYLQSNVSWPLGLAVPATLMGLSCALFFMGTRLYVRVCPEGSPFTRFACVIVAALRKRRLPAPASPEELFDPPHKSSLVSKIAYTDQFRCLDKAAVLVSEDELTPDGSTPVNPWRLCTLQQVEEVKCLARLIPVWSSGIIYYIVLTNLGNYVVLQAMQTDRRIGRSGFQVPAGSFVVFQMLALTVWIPVYDRVLVPAVERLTKREGGITLLHRIGTGIALSIATMLVSAVVERRRRSVAASGATMSCFMLVPQQLLAGLSEAFAVIGQVEFYYKQFPENMRSVAGALLFLGFALASYASGLMITVVHQTTGGSGGRPDWLAQDLNQGRVDLYYLLIAAMAAVNLVYFVACARWYRFKKSAAAVAVVELEGNDNLKANATAPPV
ncbi:protein NRT1/ PTR FAMILY 2.11-like isoform X1 [Phragmites australis]|uniref:protein NRT1/ PTR FAMILY 2.11-like isoform X1 n=2 Tax=Phragmites australis TaxID=29695 RepID=UPI002D76FB35|nr:protein NRT1/ PTR FAMILY 2.11-like isoform X1 [Phragmites australis]